MSGEKPGKRRGAVLAFASLFVAFLINAVIFAKDQPAAQQPAATTEETAAPENTATVALTSIYSVQIHRDQTRIKLRGQIASEDDHKTIVGLVKGNFASLDITDRIKVGKAAPRGNLQVGGMSFALKVLSYLEDGWASVDENSVSVDGAAGNSTLHPALQKTLNSERPAGVDVKINITPSVFWRGELIDGHLIFTGYVDAEKSKGVLTESAHDLFQSILIDNQTRVTKSAPDEWMYVALHSLKVLRNLQRGEVHVKDRTIRIEGVVSNDDAMKAITTLADKYPRAFSLESNVVVERQKSGLATIPMDDASTP